MLKKRQEEERKMLLVIYKVLLTIGISVTVATGLSLLLAVFVMIAWNCFAPIFDFPKASFLQAFSFLFLIAVISSFLKGFSAEVQVK